MMKFYYIDILFIKVIGFPTHLMIYNLNLDTNKINVGIQIFYIFNGKINA